MSDTKTDKMCFAYHYSNNDADYNQIQVEIKQDNSTKGQATQRINSESGVICVLKNEADASKDVDAYAYAISELEVEGKTYKKSSVGFDSGSYSLNEYNIVSFDQSDKSNWVCDDAEKSCSLKFTVDMENFTPLNDKSSSSQISVLFTYTGESTDNQKLYTLDDCQKSTNESSSLYTCTDSFPDMSENSYNLNLFVF